MNIYWVIFAYYLGISAFFTAMLVGGHARCLRRYQSGGGEKPVGLIKDVIPATDCGRDPVY